MIRPCSRGAQRIWDAEVALWFGCRLATMSAVVVAGFPPKRCMGAVVDDEYLVAESTQRYAHGSIKLGSPMIEDKTFRRMNDRIDELATDPLIADDLRRLAAEREGAETDVEGATDNGA
jgi:hypothetical protein